MNDSHLLNLNPNRVLYCLKEILTETELVKIREEIDRNVEQLLRLAEGHLRFARRVSGQLSWRLRVSRGYYCCYTSSRAIRLAVNGFYNVEVEDHKRIGNLPSDFPQRDIWSDLLTKFRADRNLADYDHSVTETALEMQSREYLTKAAEFLELTNTYLSGRRTT